MRTAKNELKFNKNELKKVNSSDLIRIDTLLYLLKIKTCTWTKGERTFFLRRIRSALVIQGRTLRKNLMMSLFIFLRDGDLPIL